MVYWIRSIWKLMAGHRLQYGAAIGALVVASLFLYLAPLVPQIVIDGVITDPAEAETSTFVTGAVEALGGRAFLRQNLWWPAVLIIALTGVAGVFTYLRGRWSASASEAIVRRVRDRVYDRLQHLPCSFFDAARTGDLIQRCTSDVETLRTFLSLQIVEIGRAIVMLAIPIPLMLAIDVPMTIASVALVPPVVGFSLFYFVKVKTAFKKADEAEGRMTTTIQENLTGIRVVRAFARQDFENEKLAVTNGEHRRLDYRLFVLLAWFWSISDLLCFMQKGLVVGAGTYWLATGRLSVGAFYYFLTAVTMFIWPVRMMGRILTDLGKAVVALGRLTEILDAPVESGPAAALLPPEALPPDALPPDPLPPEPLTGAIEFENVRFAHGEESPVLDGVSFAAPAGQTLALLGPSGCGKSTIVNLLLRLYDHDSGSIRLDDRAIETLDRKFVRGQTAVVMQEPFLYSKTVRENLAIGRPSAAESEVIEATMVACVHESILQFDDGYDTRVGERGVTLSGGQRQRVALARALLQDPAVLILDDALSAVDTETETMILSALRERHGRHTTIVIAHRLSTLMHADQILVLDQGRVVQHGSHRELAAQDGLYRRLWDVQSAMEPDAGREEAGPATRAASSRESEGGSER